MYSRMIMEKKTKLLKVEVNELRSSGVRPRTWPDAVDDSRLPCDSFSLGRPHRALQSAAEDCGTVL